MQNKIQVKRPFQIQKDVSKTFKKMLTSNHARSFLTSATQTNRSSTKDGESINGAVDIADQEPEYNEDIENKFAIKTAIKHKYDHKIFKEDIDQDFLKEEVDNITPKEQVRKNVREDIQQINPEYVATKKYSDQFSAINRKTEKVDITKATKYNSTS